MAVKVGEAYYEVYPQINQSKVDAARAVIGKRMSEEFKRQGAETEKINEQTNDNIIKDDVRVAKARRSNSDGTAKNLIADEGRVRRTRSTGNKTQLSEIKSIRDAYSAFSNKFQKDNKKNEGTLHRLATQFRTIGTISKGIGLGVGVLSGFSLLQDALGGIIALAPVAAAGIALIPAALAGIGVEAIIVKGAFKGIGKALGDAFDPTKAKDFQKDLQSLSPAARQFVLEIAKAKGILPNIQQNFFSAPLLKKAASNVAGFFREIAPNFKKLIGASGNLFGGVFDSLTNSNGAKRSKDFLGNLNKLVTQITPGVRNLTTGFVNFIDNVSKEFNGKGISGILTKFGNFLTNVNTHGLFTAAKAALKGFGQILGNVGGAIGGIIKAFGGSDHLGAVFFKNINGLFSEVNKFANSPKGQQFLHDLVGTLNTLSGFANTVVKTGLSFVASVFAGLYPSIKPFVAEASKLIKDIFTPQFGETLGKIASKFLDIGTQVLDKVEPAIKGIVNFLSAHPKVFTDLALGIAAIYLALKITKGVSAISTGIKGIITQLAWFTGAGPAKAATGMVEVEGGLSGVGVAADGLVGKLGLVIGKIIGAAGLLFALQQLQDFADKHGFSISSGADKIPLGKGSDSGGFKNSPFNHFLGYVHNGLDHLGDDLNGATGKADKLKGSLKQLGFGAGSGALAAAGKVPFPAKGKTPNPGSGLSGPTKQQQQNLRAITPQAFQTGPLKTFNASLNTLNGTLHKTLTTSATWGKEFPGHIASGVDASGKATKKFPSTFGAPLTTAFGHAVSGAKGMWTQIDSSSVRGLTTVGKSVSSKAKPAITVPMQSAYSQTETNTKGLWTRLDQVFGAGFGHVKALTQTLPQVFTKPTQAQYTVVEAATKRTWTNITAAFHTGIQSGVKKNVATLPAVFTTPARKTYNATIKATAATWTNIGHQFTQGVRNAGTTMAQLPKATSPGAKGLVDVYENNVKKVWDAVAKPLKLGTLPAVAFHGASVSAGKVTSTGSVAPVYVAQGGRIRGPGGPREDKVPAYLSNGEYVVNARATKRHLPLIEAINHSGRSPFQKPFHEGDINGYFPRFAGGGLYAPRGTRSGTSFPIIEQFVRALPGGSGLGISATTGGGHINNSYHYSGEAVDWTGSQALMARVAAELQQYSAFFLELIHSPNWFAHNGIREGHAAGAHTYAGVYAGHFNHIHTAMTKEGAVAALHALNSGIIPVGGSFYNGISDKQVAEIKAATKKKIPGDTAWDGLMRGIVDQNVPKLKAVTDKKAKSLNAALFAFGGASQSANAGQIQAWIEQASHYTNIPASWIPGIELIIQRESGGDPNNVNRVDSNARAGHPSIGLMQVIKGTFEAYRSHALPDSQYNPVANIVAAVNYIRGRYGSIFNVQQANPNRPPRGYASGTHGAARGWAWVGEEGKELVHFGGGETVVPHDVSMGYAKGTPPKKKPKTIPDSLKNEVRNISESFRKSSTSIKTAVNTLTNSIKNNIAARKRGNITQVIRDVGKHLEHLSDRLKDSNLAQLTAAKTALRQNVATKIASIGDITTVPFTAGEANPVEQFVKALKKDKARAVKYRNKIRKVQKLGLDPKLISSLASTDDGESIIAELSRGSKGNIKKLNRVNKQIGNLAQDASTSIANHVFNKSINRAANETAKLNKQMARLSTNLEKRVAGRLGIHRATGGFVPHVSGIVGDNVPILATPGEFVVPVGGSGPNNQPIILNATVMVDGVAVAAKVHVERNNEMVANSLGRRSGK